MECKRTIYAWKSTKIWLNLLWQLALWHIIEAGSFYSSTLLDPTLKYKLIYFPQTEFLELKPFLVPALLPPVLLGTMKRFLGCESPNKAHKQHTLVHQALYRETCQEPRDCDSHRLLKSTDRWFQMQVYRCPHFHAAVGSRFFPILKYRSKIFTANFFSLQNK